MFEAETGRNVTEQHEYPKCEKTTLWSCIYNLYFMFLLNLAELSNGII